MKKAAIIVLVATIVIAFLWNLASTLNTGTLSVEVSDQTSEVTASQSLPESVTVALGKGNSSKRLQPGIYLIEAVVGDRASRALAEVKKGRTTTVKLTLTAPVEATAIARYGARKLFADGQNLWFMNTPARQLSRLPLGGERAELFMPQIYPIKDVHWIGAEKAIVEDTRLGFYLVNAGAISDLNLFVDESRPVTSLAVTTAGSMAYVAGSKLYYRGQPQDTAVEIADLASNNAHVALSSAGAIAVTYSSAEGATPPGAAIINIHTKQSTKLPHQNAIGDLAAWSPDGQKLFYATPEAGIIYEVGSKKTRQIITSGTSNPASFTWISAARLVYIDDQAVWLYDDVSGDTVKLFGLPEDIASPRPFAIGPDGNIYLASDIKGGYGSVGTIYRFKTKP